MKHQPSDSDLAYLDDFNKLLISPESFHHSKVVQTTALKSHF